MGHVHDAERVRIVRYGVSFGPHERPYEYYDTFEQALRAFEGMKLKHQMNECIVKEELTLEQVYDGSHVSWDDAYGDNSAKAGIIEAVNGVSQ